MTKKHKGQNKPGEENTKELSDYLKKRGFGSLSKFLRDVKKFKKDHGSSKPHGATVKPDSYGVTGENEII